MVYIIVLNWNGWQDTLACLESLIWLNYPKYKIIVCDNASSNDSVIQIENWYKTHKNQLEYLKHADFQCFESGAEQDYISESENAFYLIQTGANLGYAGGNNVGIRFALKQVDMEYVWVLNNDTEVEPGSLNNLVSTAQATPDAGVIGSRMVYFDDRSKQQGLGGIYNKYLAITHHFEADKDSFTIYDDKLVSSQIDYVIGAALFFPRKSLEKIGLMCEDYFLYYEEFDYSMRASQAGYQTLVDTSSIVYHKVGATANQGAGIVSDFYQVRNRLIVCKKFYPRFIPLVYLSIFAVLLRRLIKGDLAKARNILSILWQPFVFIIVKGK